MHLLTKITHQLSGSIKDRGSVSISIWSNQTWGDLFMNQGTGLIRKGKLRRLFSERELSRLGENQSSLAEKTPEKIEEILSNKYVEYKAAGFWTKTRMYFTERTDIYEHVYAIVTLRKLQNNFDTLAKQAENISALQPSEWSNFFTHAMDSLNLYYSSLLSQEVGFFQKLFENKKMYSHVMIFQQSANKVLDFLRSGIENSCVQLAKKIHTNSQDNNEIKQWYETHKNKLDEQNNNIEQKHRSEYRKIYKSLMIRYNLLLKTMQAATNRENDQPVLLPEMKKNIDDGFNKLIKWMNDFRENNNRSDQKPVSAAEYQKKIDGANPDSMERMLLKKFNTEFENSLANPDNLSSVAIKLQQYAMQVLACLDYMPIRKQECYRQYDELKQNSGYYSLLTRAISKRILDTKIHCMDMMVYGEISDKQIESAKLKVKDIESGLIELQENTEFLALPQSAQKYLINDFTVHLTCINKLMETYSQIQDQRNKNNISISISNQQYTKIREEFANELHAGLKQIQVKHCLTAVAITESELELAKNLLQKIAKNMFQQKILASPPDFQGLKIAYFAIENIKMKYLNELQGKTIPGTMVLLPEKLEPSETPLVSIANIRKNPQMLQTIMERLRDEFDEIKSPRNNTRCLWIQLSGRNETILGNMLQSMKRTLLNPAYVFVKFEWGKTIMIYSLYYVDRDSSVMERIDIDLNVLKTIDEKMKAKKSGTFLSDEECIYITDKTNHCHDRKIGLYLAILDLFYLRLEGAMWGEFERDDFTDRRCDLLWSISKPDFDEARRSNVSYYIYTSDNELFYYSRQEDKLYQFSFMSMISHLKFITTFSSVKGRIRLNKDQLDFMQIHTTELRNEDRLLTTLIASLKIAYWEIEKLYKVMSAIYHPDKYSGSDEWQKFIPKKMEQTKRKIHDLYMKQFDVRWFVEHNAANLDSIRKDIPQWILIKNKPDINAALYVGFLQMDNEVENHNNRIADHSQQSSNKINTMAEKPDNFDEFSNDEIKFGYNDTDYTIKSVSKTARSSEMLLKVNAGITHEHLKIQLRETKKLVRKHNQMHEQKSQVQEYELISSKEEGYIAISPDEKARPQINNIPVKRKESDRLFSIKHTTKNSTIEVCEYRHPEKPQINIDNRPGHG